MTTSEKMRDLAFKNKDVQQAYKKALSEILESANYGDLFVEIDNDETVLELLKKEGFNISHILSPKKVKVSW